MIDFYRLLCEQLWGMKKERTGKHYKRLMIELLTEIIWYVWVTHIRRLLKLISRNQPADGRARFHLSPFHSDSRCEERQDSIARWHFPAWNSDVIQYSLPNLGNFMSKSADSCTIRIVIGIIMIEWKRHKFLLPFRGARTHDSDVRGCHAMHSVTKLCKSLRAFDMFYALLGNVKICEYTVLPLPDDVTFKKMTGGRKKISSTRPRGQFQDFRVHTLSPNTQFYPVYFNFIQIYPFPCIFIQFYYYPILSSFIQFYPVLFSFIQLYLYPILSSFINFI